MKIPEDLLWNDEYSVYIHRLRSVQLFFKDPICDGPDLGCTVLSMCILKSPLETLKQPYFCKVCKTGLFKENHLSKPLILY